MKKFATLEKFYAACEWSYDFDYLVSPMAPFENCFRLYYENVFIARYPIFGHVYDMGVATQNIREYVKGSDKMEIAEILEISRKLFSDER